jgi:hypothetical protein
VDVDVDVDVDVRMTEIILNVGVKISAEIHTYRKVTFD